jgi:hypothetical protein
MASLYRTEAGAQLIARRYQEFLKFWPQPNRQLVNGHDPRVSLEALAGAMCRATRGGLTSKAGRADDFWTYVQKHQNTLQF